MGMEVLTAGALEGPWGTRGSGGWVCPTSSQTCSEKITDRMPVDGYRPWPCSQLSKTYLMKAGW